MNREVLHEHAEQIVSKVILAADESSGTIKKRLATVGIESTPEINRQYRLLLFETPRIEEFVSGVILFDETFRQADDRQVAIPDLLAQKGIVPGIKVDRGTALMPGSSKDTFTQGLDDLGKRLREYADLGALFSKWRAVFTIDSDSPKPVTIDRNAHDLALYAALCQDVGLVPIVEPEILMAGHHTMGDCERVTANVLGATFRKLEDYGISFPGMILKPNMITPDADHLDEVDPKTVAKVTLQVLRDTVNYSVPGIPFLSGGLSPDMATTDLYEINVWRNANPIQYPWSRLTASFGRALQGEALEAWRGGVEKKPEAQAAFIDRAEKVYKASFGQL